MLNEKEIEALKGMADDLDKQITTIISGPMPSREFALFVTKMEEAYLWLRRAIEKAEVK